MHLIYKLGINLYWVDECKKKIGRKGTSVSLLPPFGILPANTHLSTSINLPSQKKYQHQLHFSLFYNMIIVWVFFRDLWSSISICSHCFILLNGFSNLPRLNLILVLRVNCRWGYTDFILCMKLAKEDWLAILIEVLKKSYLTLKNMLLLWILLAV